MKHYERTKKTHDKGCPFGKGGQNCGHPCKSSDLLKNEDYLIDMIKGLSMEIYRYTSLLEQARP